jgi:hypothetical protein
MTPKLAAKLPSSQLWEDCRRAKALIHLPCGSLSAFGSLLATFDSCVHARMRARESRLPISSQNLTSSQVFQIRFMKQYVFELGAYREVISKLPVSSRLTLRGNSPQCLTATLMGNSHQRLRYRCSETAPRLGSFPAQDQCGRQTAGETQVNRSVNKVYRVNAVASSRLTRSFARQAERIFHVAA